MFALPDGGEVTLSPGDLIGRLASAELHVNDARVSEAHAMLSLRGRELRLLSLRGSLTHRQQPSAELALREGMTLELFPGYALRVLRLVLPEAAVALRVGDAAPELLQKGRASLLSGSLRLHHGHVPEARAWIWSTGDRWYFQARDEATEAVEPGWSRTLDGVPLTLELLRIEGVASTIRQSDGPLRILARYDSVRISRAGQPDLVLGGMSARILSELILFDKPVHWAVVAGELWTDEQDEARLRMRWDRSLKRMRLKLKAGGLGREMVRSLGQGLVELERRIEDEVVDDS